MDYQELIERLRKKVISPFDLWPVADAIESLLAENERLKAELAKYCDAPVACAQYQDREGNWKPFINANHEHNTRASMDWPVRDLIVKPEENK